MYFGHLWSVSILVCVFRQVVLLRYRSFLTNVGLFRRTFWCFQTLVICVFLGVCFRTSCRPNTQVSFDKYTGLFWRILGVCFQTSHCDCRLVAFYSEWKANTRQLRVKVCHSVILEWKSVILEWKSFTLWAIWSKETPLPGGVSYLLRSLIKNPEDKDPHRRICTRCFEGGPLHASSWSGNIVNRKPPRGGGVPFETPPGGGVSFRSNWGGGSFKFRVKAFHSMISRWNSEWKSFTLSSSKHTVSLCDLSNIQILFWQTNSSFFDMFLVLCVQTSLYDRRPVALHSGFFSHVHSREGRGWERKVKFLKSRRYSDSV